MRFVSPAVPELVLATFFILGACNLGEPEADLVDGPVTDTCATGLYWTAGDVESELMRPGGDCIGCHTEEGEGPIYAAAGTVMSSRDEEDDCAGLFDVVVEVIDAEGNVHATRTNAAGNFWFDETLEIPTPYTARVTTAAGTLEMTTEQTNTNCMFCHTAGGVPGRIVVE
jgi:mono/diheme cytochrome c family protein